MKRLALLLLILPLFALQWAVPVMQIMRGEAILRDGTALRLALQPVDPFDVMRGRYLALSFPESAREHNLPEGMHAGDTLYAPPAVQALASRLLLHASALQLTHPATGKPLRLASRTQHFDALFPQA